MRGTVLRQNTSNHKWERRTAFLDEHGHLICLDNGNSETEGARDFVVSVEDCDECWLDGPFEDMDSSRLPGFSVRCKTAGELGRPFLSTSRNFLNGAVFSLASSRVRRIQQR